MCNRLCVRGRQIDSRELAYGKYLCLNGAGLTYICYDICKAWRTEINRIRPLGALESFLPRGTPLH